MKTYRFMVLTKQVNNDAVVDEVVANVQATDGDAFAPGNIVKYRLITEESSERAGVYFRVDTDSGDIILQGKDGDRMFQVLIAQGGLQYQLSTKLGLTIKSRYTKSTICISIPSKSFSKNLVSIFLSR